MARAEDAIIDTPDPFEDVDWFGWARFGRGPGCKWHRVRVVVGPDGRRLPDSHPDAGYLPLCGCRRDPMPPGTAIFDYRWDPGSLDRCFDCWPSGVPHPGIISDLPPDKRYR